MRRLVFCVLVAAALASINVRLADYAFDDALIHARIAEHLVGGVGPYFNPPDRGMASSSSAWTLLLALLSSIGGGRVAVALVNALLVALCVPVYGSLIRRQSGDGASPLVADLLAAVTVVPMLSASSSGLMETPLAVLLAGLGLLFLQAERPVAFACLTAACFVRVELSVLYGTCALAALVRRHVRLRDLVLWSAVGGGGFLVYDLWFFGTIVPSAVRAKAVGYQIAPSDVVWRLVSHIADGLTPLVMARLFPLLVAIGLYLVFRSRLGIWARTAYLTGVIIVCTYVGTGAMVFEWYIPLFAVALAWPVAAAFIASTSERAIVPIRQILCGLILLLLVGPSGYGFARTVQAAVVNPAYAPHFMQGARVRRYREVGRSLFAAFPDATLLTSEIGGLGDGFRGRIEDGFGLVSPSAIRFHPMRVPEERASGIVGAIPPGFAAEVNPALIVSYDIFDDAFERSSVAERYIRLDVPPFIASDVARATAAGIPSTLWGIQTLHVYFRRDVYEIWQRRGQSL